MRAWLVPLLLTGVLTARAPAALAERPPERQARKATLTRPDKPKLLDRLLRSRAMGVINAVNLASTVGNAAAAVITRSPEHVFAAATSFTMWSSGTSLRRDARRKALPAEAPARPAQPANVWGQPTSALP